MKGATDGHNLTHRFHCGGQMRLRPRKFFKREAGNFGDDIVDAGFKRGRRNAGDVIVQLVQRIANGKFCGDFGDGEAGGFRCQGGAARYTRVHFDHHHAAISGVDRPLHV